MNPPAVNNPLNPVQKEAITTTDGPILILAGAGSGKTRVLMEKAAFLLTKKGIDPQNILISTFTNKAAGEMRGRLSKLVSRVPTMMGTFHSLCARMLRVHASALGLPPGFMIYDEDDALSTVKRALATLNRSTKDVSPMSIRGAISSAKNELIGPAEYRRVAHGNFQERAAEVYPVYQRMLSESGAVDFDDLLRLTIVLFEQHPDILRRAQTQFHYILVDEYQDVNTVQYLLVKLLSETHRNICVVGDASQSIYSWRGADVRNIHRFQEDFPDAKTFRLEQNYRSTQRILDAAEAVISKNTSHPILSLWTQKNTGPLLTVYQAADEQDEVNFIIAALTDSKIPQNDAAILYRTNAQSRVIEEALLHAGIPYRLVGGVRFYARKEIKDLLAFLRLVANPNDHVAHERLLALPKKRTAAFHAIRTELSSDRPTIELLDHVLTATGFLEQFDESTEEGLMRRENVKELRSVAQTFPNMVEFLENVALVEQTDPIQTAGVSAEKDALTLMTMHSAKGLEYHTIFLVGMEEGLFPHARSMADPASLEEERRLCYVGITRAKERLFLSFAEQRLLFGRTSRNLPSRFLDDIPNHVVQHRISPRIRADTSEENT
ncbi:MAG: UvrD-helicase domain-containing protein, partial [bacterium]|nr:UvrD-helicase domain-containing protein [bacterium]